MQITVHQLQVPWAEKYQQKVTFSVSRMACIFYAILFQRYHLRPDRIGAENASVQADKFAEYKKLISPTLAMENKFETETNIDLLINSLLAKWVR